MKRLEVRRVLGEDWEEGSEYVVLYRSVRKGTIYCKAQRGGGVYFCYRDIWSEDQPQYKHTHWSLHHMKTHLRGYFDRQLIALL